jgi:hypothetical protein
MKMAVFWVATPHSLLGKFTNVSEDPAASIVIPDDGDGRDDNDDNGGRKNI